MGYQIIYKKRFIQKLFKLLDYLKLEWSQRVVDNFIVELRQRLSTISEHPFVGAPPTKITSVRSVLIIKHNRSFYRIKGNQIEVINMFDTRSNPRKNKYM